MTLPQERELLAGGWDDEGTWVPMPYVDAKAAERFFRHKVIAFLRDEELLSEERIELLLSGRTPGARLGILGP